VQVWRARLGDQAAPSTADARRMEAQWIFQMALSHKAASAYEEAVSSEVEAQQQQDPSLAGRWSKLNPLGHRARFLRGLLVCGACVEWAIAPLERSTCARLRRASETCDYDGGRLALLFEARRTRTMLLIGRELVEAFVVVTTRRVVG
jgi:hypothetical protein